MYKLFLIFYLVLFQIEVESFEDERNKVLFEKLYAQNQRLWTFVNNKKKIESKNQTEYIRPSAIKISHLSRGKVEKKSSSKTNDDPPVNLAPTGSIKAAPKSIKSYPDYLVSDPADDDLQVDSSEQLGNLPRPKGWQADDEIGEESSTIRDLKGSPEESPKLVNNIEKPLPIDNSSKQKVSSKYNALQRAWNSLINVTKSIGRPKPLTKESQRRNFKLWSFQIGLRNLINNDSDGFKHDAEVFHQLGYRLDDRQKVFVEHKSVTMTGDGFGKVTRTGVGYQHYLKSVNEVSDYYPYFALFYDHWKGNFDNFQGIPTSNNKSSRDVLTTRLGIEVPLTNTTNLDFYWERGKKFLDFTDTRGSKIEIHARNNLYGMGLSHSF